MLVVLLKMSYQRNGYVSIAHRVNIIKQTLPACMWYISDFLKIQTTSTGAYSMEQQRDSFTPPPTFRPLLANVHRTAYPLNRIASQNASFVCTMIAYKYLAKRRCVWQTDAEWPEQQPEPQSREAPSSFKQRYSQEKSLFASCVCSKQCVSGFK